MPGGVIELWLEQMMENRAVKFLMAIYLVDAGQDIMIEVINGGGHPANFISVFISTIPAVWTKVGPDFRIGTMTE